MSTGKITHLKDIETETLRQRIEFLELQVQGYRQNCDRLERRIAEMGIIKGCVSCAHLNAPLSDHPCRKCISFCYWEPSK